MDALAAYRKLDYVRGLNGHCEFSSANALQHSVKMAINMDSKYNRFKADLPGGYFSSTTANPSSFDKKVSSPSLLSQ